MKLKQGSKNMLAFNKLAAGPERNKQKSVMAVNIEDTV